MGTVTWDRVEGQVRRHPVVKAYVNKVRKDNIRFLVAAVAWNILISAVPLTLGMIVLTRIFAGSTQQRETVDQLSRAFQGVLGPKYLDRLVSLTVHHSGLLLAVTLLAALWGAWNVGFALSSAFDAMFEVGSRHFLHEKLIDVAMFFVLVLLMFLIVAATTARSAMTHTINRSSLPDVLNFPLTTLVTLACAFVLFAVLYMVYPNTQTRLKLANVWRGALLAAVLFQLLTYIWPLYEAHLSRYGGLLFPILVLVLWIYFFAFILVLGAEVVALSAIQQAEERGEEVGPAPDGTVPEHRTLPQGHRT